MKNKTSNTTETGNNANLLLSLVVSQSGKNFSGNNITEDNLRSHQKVLYKNKEYITGNRYHNLVELWIDGKLKISNADMKDIRLIL